MRILVDRFIYHAPRRQGDKPYLIRTYALRSQDQDEKRSLSAIVCWHVRRGGMIKLRLGEVEMIIRRWRRLL